MKICVEMMAEEFQEFLRFKKDNEIYHRKLEEVRRNGDMLARKVQYALEPDPKKKGMVRVADKEHLAELYEMAVER